MSIGTGKIEINAGADKYAEFGRSTSYVYGGKIGLSIGKNGAKLGFFGSTGAARKSVTTMTDSSATVSLCASKINEIIEALKAYNLIG